MRKLAMLMALLLCFGSAFAQELQADMDARSAFTELAASMPREEIHAIVEKLFAAAAGTALETETALREGMTEEELLLRNAENAQYRAKTLPWLMEALRPEENTAETSAETAADDPVGTGAEAAADQPGQAAAEDSSEAMTGKSAGTAAEPAENPAEPSAQAAPAWTTADSYAALMENEAGRAYLEAIQALGGRDMESCMAVTRAVCAQWMAEVDHAMLAEMNGDYVCWLYAPDTQIDYPVVQCENNSRYLDRMFNGERNSAGTLFIDYRNLPDFQDPNTLIYGHHMRNDSMFGALTDYVRQACFESHPYMLLMDGEGVWLLEIFAGYATTDEDHCYDIAISDSEDMLEFVRMAREKSDFDAVIEILPGERLVTLSTCAYFFEDARYIVIGRLLPVCRAMEVSAETMPETGGDALDR